MYKKKEFGQGSIEYLLLMAGAILMVTIILSLSLTTFPSIGGGLLSDNLNGYQNSITLTPGGDNNPPPPPPPPLTCGNGKKDLLEQCEGGDLGGQSCESLGYDTGTLTCAGDCTFNESLCQNNPPPGPICGNNVVEPPEECDDGNMVSGDGCSSTCQIEVTPPLTYQFNAKFEPPMGRIVQGDGPWKVYEQKLLDKLPSHDLFPASELNFMDLAPYRWDKTKAKLPIELADYDAKGVIPSLDMALSIYTPLPSELPSLPDPYYGVDQDIANTNIYDQNIGQLADILKTYGKPVMFRIGGEFNGPWKGYHPYEYPKAFRKIVQIFEDHGATNVAFIWCTEPAAPGDFDEQNALGEWKWFPGADVVDWFGIDLYAPADVSGSTSPTKPYGKTLKFLQMSQTFNKPVIIAESGVATLDIKPDNGALIWNSFLVPMFDLMTTHPEIKWFDWLNMDWTKDPHAADGGWKNSDITVSDELLQDWIGEMQKSKYIHTDERNLLNGYNDYP